MERMVEKVRDSDYKRYIHFLSCSSWDYKGMNAITMLQVSALLIEHARIYEQQFDKVYAYENLKVMLESNRSFSFDRNVTIKYEVFEAEKKFRLSDGAHKAYLGVNTTL